MRFWAPGGAGLRPASWTPRAPNPPSPLGSLTPGHWALGSWALRTSTPLRDYDMTPGFAIADWIQQLGSSSSAGHNPWRPCRSMIRQSGACWLVQGPVCGLMACPREPLTQWPLAHQSTVDTGGLTRHWTGRSPQPAKSGPYYYYGKYGYLRIPTSQIPHASSLGEIRS